MILVTGAAGQLGSGLIRFFENNNIAVMGVDCNNFDITNHDETIEYITKLRPTCVFHCAAYGAKIWSTCCCNRQMGDYKVSFTVCRDAKIYSKRIKLFRW